MDINLFENYIYTCFLGQNFETLHESSLVLYDFVITNFQQSDGAYTGKSTLSTVRYNLYNVFFYPFDGFHELFFSIRDVFRICNSDACMKTNYYIQCWLNVYKEDDFIDWHSHWPPESRSWHGFYCVNGANSSTSYCLPGKKIGQSDVIIESKNDLLVLSRSDGDKHKSSPWKNDVAPRITIAFDIVPIEYLNMKRTSLSHWVPF